MSNEVYEAVLWETLEGGEVRCGLCNFRCVVKEGKLGICHVRQNIDGRLYSMNYHSVCSTGIDPVEKKPLFHYQPGRRSFSVAAPGCNLRCDFCQNWQISQYPRMHNGLHGNSYSPEQIVTAAVEHGCRSISYTYTEPTIFMEFATDCGRLAKQKGLGNVFVSNGFMTTEAIDYARDFLDAINVDLKAFSEDFYRDLCKAKLQPVLDTLRYIARETDIWLEVTTLVVSGQNDTDEQLKGIAEFIAGELGNEVPWHISRFRPDFKMAEAEPTPVETLERAYGFGKEAGLRYIYIGNLPGGGWESTNCHECGGLLIERNGYQIGQYNVINSSCPDCGTALAGKDLDPVKV